MRRMLLAGVLCLIAVALMATAEEKARMTTGEVVSVDESGATLVVLKDDGEKVSFVVEPATVVRLHGPKGKVNQLKAGDIVTVTYLLKDGKSVATQIQHM